MQERSSGLSGCGTSLFPRVTSPSRGGRDRPTAGPGGDCGAGRKRTPSRESGLRLGFSCLPARSGVFPASALWMAKSGTPDFAWGGYARFIVPRPIRPEAMRILVLLFLRREAGRFRRPREEQNNTGALRSAPLGGLSPLNPLSAWRARLTRFLQVHGQLIKRRTGPPIKSRAGCVPVGRMHRGTPGRAPIRQTETRRGRRPPFP